MKTTERFSSRVANYVKYRPGYPREVVARLEKLNVLQPASSIADIGSGTGISAKIFLDAGYTVVGVEPNAEMRKAGEEFLGEYLANGAFVSVDGTAEETKIRDHGVSAAIAGQAFHWFDVEKTRNEFRRILTPGGYVALLWNGRRTASTAFLREYEALLLEFATDYREVNHMNLDEKNFDAFWGKGNWQMFSVPNFQDFDYAGLEGRLLSSSYVPSDASPEFRPMLDALKELFDRHAQNGVVRIEYDTLVYYGQLKM
jgi:SAM-dependent methyltransferase